MLISTDPRQLIELDPFRRDPASPGDDVLELVHVFVPGFRDRTCGHRESPAKPVESAVTILCKTPLAFFGADGRVQGVMFVKYIDVTRYDDVVLVVRVHEVSLGAGQSFDVLLDPVSKAEDEPETLFVTTDGQIRCAITSSTTAPGLVLAGATVVPGHYRLQVSANQAATAAAMSATISVTLALRSRSPAEYEDSVDRSGVFCRPW